MSLCATYISGSERDGLFVHIEPQNGGWGATRDRDGASGMIAITDGDTYNYSIELLEAKFPLLIRRYDYNVKGGVGAGRASRRLRADPRIRDRMRRRRALWQLRANRDAAMGRGRRRGGEPERHRGDPRRRPHPPHAHRRAFLSGAATSCASSPAAAAAGATRRRARPRTSRVISATGSSPPSRRRDLSRLRRSGRQGRSHAATARLREGSAMTRIATDAGGTFTDLVAFDEKTGADFRRQGADDAARSLASASSKPSARPAETGLDGRDVSFFVHGGTTVINAITERKGVKTALVTTRRFPRRDRHRPRQPARPLQSPLRAVGAFRAAAISASK